MTNLAGQIGIVHSKPGWTPWLVRLVTGSYWSHVVIALDSSLCVSAEPGGAIIRSIDFYRNIVWSQFDLTTSQRQVITLWAYMHVGTPYSWVKFYIAGIGAMLKRHTPVWLERLAADTDSMICSQLADRALQSIGINLFDDRRPRGAVTPASFGRVFHENGWADRP